MTLILFFKMIMHRVKHKHRPYGLYQLFTLVFSKLLLSWHHYWLCISKKYAHYATRRRSIYVLYLAFRMSKLHSFSIFGHAPKAKQYSLSSALMIFGQNSILTCLHYIFSLNSIKQSNKEFNKMLEKYHTRSVF